MSLSYEGHFYLNHCNSLALNFLYIFARYTKKNCKIISVSWAKHFVKYNAHFRLND